MKNVVNVACFLLLVLFSSAVFHDVDAASLESGKPPGVYLNEIGIGSGYAWGSLKREPVHLTVYPAFVRIGFNMNSLVGMEDHQSTLQLVFEPFLNSMTAPKTGVETGCSIGLRYLHPLSVSVALFTEASFAPMFLSIKSVEQGAAGFNFLDQLGAGLQYKVSERTAIFGGYRFRHISHAGLVNRPNGGINSNALVAGFSWLY
ncbi:MAG: acyloxyacyl hydrolase [Chlorobiaceae bacterium]|jgi:lipid A 3-O-deacylase